MTEPRNRATGGLAAVLASLDTRLENEADVLDAFLLAMSKGQLDDGAWDRLGQAAQRDQRLAELAFAFEQLTGDRRLRTLQAGVVAEFMFQAAVFFGDAFGDEMGSAAYLDRALAAVPTHAGSLARREEILARDGNFIGIGDMYAELASHRPRAEQVNLYRKAADAYERVDAVDKVADALTVLVRIDPKDDEARARLLDALARANRPREVAKLLEQALTHDPAPADDVQLDMRWKLLDAYAGVGELERSLPHVEWILSKHPDDVRAHDVAVQLLEGRATVARAAAALAGAAQMAGSYSDAARYYMLELEQARGPRRAFVLRALAALREDHLDDPAGAYEAADAALGLDPNDGALVERYVNLTRVLGKHEASAKTLTRLLGLAKDPNARARLSTASGELLLANGDVRRARAAFSSALSVPGATDEATLGAVRALARLYEEEEDNASLADMLDRMARVEPEPDRRLAAAERLAALAAGPLGDPARAIGSWRALLDTPARAKALAALEPLLGDIGDAIGLAEVLRARAEDSTDVEEQRALLQRAAEALTEASGNIEAASAAWRDFIGRFGPSREAVARWIPLLELRRDFSALDGALTMASNLWSGEERARTLATLGILRAQNLQDPRGAIEAFASSLEANPNETTSRDALERLLDGKDDALAIAAANVLEPVYRHEGANAGLFHVQCVRATRGPDAPTRLAAAAAALAAAESVPQERARAFDLAAAALGDAVESGAALAPWIGAIDHFAPGDEGARRRATALRRALGDRAVDGPELLALARAAGDAAMSAGDRAGALDAFQRALAFAPSSPDVMASVELLLRDQGTPEDRLRLYQSALQVEQNPAKRRTLFAGIAQLQRAELGDVTAAQATLVRALEEDPDDRGSAEALFALYLESSAWLEACRILEHELVRTAPGADERALHARIADLATAHGLRDRAIAHARALVEDELATATDLDLVERVAEQLEERALLGDVMSRRADASENDEERTMWLTRLGSVLVERSEIAGAVSAFHRAAAIAEKVDDIKTARRLFERIRKIAPYDRDATLKLIAIAENGGETALLPELYASRVEAAATVEERRDALLHLSSALERCGDRDGAFDAAMRAFGDAPQDPAALALASRLARESGHTDVFLRAVDGALAQIADVDARAPILLERAAVLANLPDAIGDAASSFRALAENDRVADAIRVHALAQMGLLFQTHPESAPRDDWEWLFSERARRAGGPERGVVLFDWARTAETRFQDTDRALELYREANVVDPATGAATEIARITLARGDVDGALASLRDQLNGADADRARRIRGDVAAILVSQGGRAREALDELSKVLALAPDDAQALKLTADLVADPEAGDAAAALLEETIAKAGDAEAQSRALDALLRGARSASPERRAAWHDRAIEAASARGPKEEFAAILRALDELPNVADRWDRAEQLARDLDQPLDLAELYQGVVARVSDREQAEELGQRAVAFHEEWFEERTGVVKILDRIVTVDPGGWAFDRLKLLYDAAERWDELFVLYDRVLATDLDDGRRVELLADAAQIAKDFAKNADRAMRYLEALLLRKPKNDRLIASLERLYERHGRHRELVGLLEAQLGGKTPQQIAELRGRIARLWLDELSDAGSALLVVEAMIADGDEGDTTRELLEQILTAAPPAEELKKTLPPTSSPLSERIAQAYESIPPPRASVPPARASVAPPRASVPPPGKSSRSKRVLVRQRAAGLLRERYAQLGRDVDLARVLEVELEDVKSAKERIRRHRELVELYERIGNDVAALAHGVSLVMLEPDSAPHRQKLASLAERTGRHDRLAEVLAAAADECEGDELRVALLMEAAVVHSDRLADPGRAIDLYFRVLAFDVDHEVLLRAARPLEGLLERAGREPERLGVLERIAQLETRTEERRGALGEAARLAASLGEIDRGIAAWEARLAEDSSDLVALHGLVAILEASGRHRPLYEALERRARLLPSEADKQADRVRAARLLGGELADDEAAIKAWEGIEHDFGATEDSTLALADLYERGSHWKKLSKLLVRAAESAPEASRAAILVRLGDLRRVHLGATAKAVVDYRSALEAESGHPGAIAGLTALLGDGDAATSAMDVLLADHRARDAWRDVLQLQSDRLRIAADDQARIAILLEAAKLEEDRGLDPAAAFRSCSEAFVLSRGDIAIDATLARLAAVSDNQRARAEVLRTVLETLEASGTTGEAIPRLRKGLADVLEQHLDDPRTALTLYLRVAEEAPLDEVAGVASVRVGARVQRWDATARVIIDRAAALGQVDDLLLGELEARVTGNAGWDAATGALEAALAERSGLPANVVRDLEARIATWHRDRRGDPDAAEAAYARALSQDGTNADLLRALAQLQRRTRGRPLIETLLRLSQATGGDPELLREAADVAASVVVDRGLAKTILERLLKLASERWVGEADTEEAPLTQGSPRHPGEYVEWAMGELVRIHNEEGNAERIVSLLSETARLPFETARARELRHEAARMALERVGDQEAALRLYAELEGDDPDDALAAERLAAVLRTLDRRPDLLALRKRQIARASTAAVRLPLRLDAAALESSLDKTDAALALLKDNLGEQPRHAESAAMIIDVLEAAGRNAELIAFLAEQAHLAEAEGDIHAAATMFRRAAVLADSRQNDTAAALGYFQRVLPLVVEADDLDAIAKLHERQGDHSAAAQYLERLLHKFPDRRAGVILRLTDALVTAGHEEDARRHLEAAVEATGSPAEVPQRLAELYRKAELYAPLADLLTRQASKAETPAEKRRGLEEAADLWLTRCQAPGRAAELLSEAAELAPDDRALRLRLSQALTAAGRPDDARTLLRSMLDAFGGRRPKERAQVHFHLARLLLALGERTPALAELEAATRIDPANPEILRMVAELARDDGQLEKAERSYRALLSVLRRDSDGMTVARSEVLIELAEIADRQDEKERAAEIVESAFEAATTSDAEAVRLEDALRAKKKNDLLLRALRGRLERAEGGEKRAQVLADMARAQEELGDDAGALDTRLTALEAAPASRALRDAALAGAKKSGTTERYVERLLALGDRLASEGNGKDAAQLLHGAAAVIEEETGDSARAATVLERASDADPLNADVLRALDRTYAKTDDPRQEKVLARLIAALAEGAKDPKAAADAEYRLAELRLKPGGDRASGAALLKSAFEKQSDHERALKILEPALEGATEPALFHLYERIARTRGDAERLLRAIELSARAGCGTPELYREGVEEAKRAGKLDVADVILERSISEEGDFGRWARLELATLREASDPALAARLRLEAATTLPPAEARKLRLEVAQAAGTTPAIAREAIEAVLASEPNDLELRGTLLALLRTHGTKEELEEALRTTAALHSASPERSALRVEHAKLLATALDRATEAIAELREVLEEDPLSEDAATVLVDLLEGSGDKSELVALLERRLEAARDRADAPGVATVAARLGKLLEGDDAEKARSVYATGLDWEAKNPELLRGALRVIPASEGADRAELLERLLEQTRGEEGEKLALDLFAVRNEAWDSEGAERALELGLAAAPESANLRERLLAIYTERNDAAKLAKLHETTAAALVPAEAEAAFLEAARHYGAISDTAGVVRVMRGAYAIPGAADTTHIAYYRALADADDVASSWEELSNLESQVSGTPMQAAWLLERARLALRTERFAEAVDSGEAAYRDDGRLAEHLSEILALAAAGTTDENDRRSYRVRLATLCDALGRTDDARNQLEQVLQTHEQDAEALRALADLEARADRVDAETDVLARLVEVVPDAEVAEIALRLVDRATRTGSPGYARAGLERAHRLAPEDERVSEKLGEIYGALGDVQALAALRIAEAERIPEPPKRLPFYVAAATLLLGEGGDATAATDVLRRALEIKPGDLECTSLLADAYIGQSNLAAADELLRAVLEKHKGRRSKELSHVYLRLARVARASGDRGNDLAMLGTALDMDGQNGAVASELAWVARELGSTEIETRALRTITMLRAQAPMSRAEAYERLGELALEAGDNKRAVMLLKRAIDDDPSRQLARDLLARID